MRNIIFTATDLIFYLLAKTVVESNFHWNISVWCMGKKIRALSEGLSNNLKVLQEIASSKLYWWPWQSDSDCNYVIAANIKYTVTTSIVVTTQTLTQNTRSILFKTWQGSPQKQEHFLPLKHCISSFFTPSFLNIDSPPAFFHYCIPYGQKD